MIPSTEQGLRRLNGTHSNVWCEFFGNRRGGVFPPVRYGFAPLDEGLETKPLQDLQILIHTKRSNIWDFTLQLRLRNSGG